jgi:hypothetical protein
LEVTQSQGSLERVKKRWVRGKVWVGGIIKVLINPVQSVDDLETQATEQLRTESNRRDDHRRKEEEKEGTKANKGNQTQKK